METINILWRNMRWRYQNPVSILLTIIQPLLWLVLYSAIAASSMQESAGGNYTAFILPGIMVLVTLSCCSSGGYLNFIMKSKGSYYRILIAPVRRSSIVLGQMLESILLSLFEIGILFALSLLLSVHIESGVTGMLLMLPLVFVTAFFMSALSYTISLCLPNEVIYETVMNLIVLCIFFGSSALFPSGNISDGLQIAIMLNPFTHIINCLRDLLFVASINWLSILGTFSLFLCLCLCSFALAIWKLKKEYRQ